MCLPLASGKGRISGLLGRVFCVEVLMCRLYLDLEKMQIFYLLNEGWALLTEYSPKGCKGAKVLRCNGDKINRFISFYLESFSL